MRAEGRRGFTVVETLVALTLGWLVAYLALTTLARHRSAMARLIERSEALSAVRMGRVVLGAETRVAAPGRDGWIETGEELSLRAYRGVALPCLPPAGDSIVVRVEGDRLPDPAKDSVLLVDFTGAGAVRALLRRTSADPTACGDDGAAERWVLSGIVPRETVLLRYWERVGYHMADRALRVRRGAGGRQPLTPEVLDTSEPTFSRLGRNRGVRVVTVDPFGRARVWPSLLLRPTEEPDAATR